MNLALPALIVTLFALPGILFWYAYRRGFGPGFDEDDSDNPPLEFFPTGGLSQDLLFGLLCTLVVHLLMSIPVSLHGLRIRYDLVFALLLGTTGENLNEALRNLQFFHSEIISYVIASNVGALVFGVVFHSFIVRMGWDIRFPIFRFPNPWKYLFTGKAEAFYARSRQEIDSMLPDFVYVTAAANEGGKAVLYWGILDNYFFNSKGELDRIYLRAAKWASMQINSNEANSDDLAKPANNTPRTARNGQPVGGDRLVLKYSEIVNLNVEYIIFLSETSSVS